MQSDEDRSPQIDPLNSFNFESKHITHLKSQITVGVISRESRGSGLKKHVAYLIKGEDRNGGFEVWRRFNQFHEMRITMVRAWPGCLIPSLPSKNPLLKNEEQIIKKRERYLNDFLKKMAMRAFLYYSEEFQALLRSQQSNLSDTFGRWPAPTAEGIIVKYKETFSALSGKQINNETIEVIFKFHHWLEDKGKTLVEYRKVAKEMAFQRDRFNKYLVEFFKSAKLYEEAIMTTYSEPDKLIYINPKFNVCQQHEDLAIKTAETNPYWILYDLIKNEERDGRAFVELIKSIELYTDRAKEVQGRIETNVKGISETTAGKKTIKTIGMKGTADEIKYQLQVENEDLKKEKEHSQTLRDIIIALVFYIEIDEYKISKKRFYEYTINKLARFEIYFTGEAASIWQQLQEGIEQLVEDNI